MKRRTLQLLLLAAISSSSAMGQSTTPQIDCTTGAVSQKLVCEFPFATGLFANASALGGGTGQANAQQVATSLNIAIATQVSQLPLSSASAGVVLVYKNGVPETFYDLGPILTDRGQTIGRHKFFLGFTASQFVFTDIDGVPLGKLPFTYFRSAYNSSGAFVSNTYTTETTNLSFRINQFIGVATFGLTDKVDLSVIVPSEKVMLSDSTSAPTNYVVDAGNNLLFQYGGTAAHFPGSASGVGDVNVNLKAVLWRRERATFSAAGNVRAPTGDHLNLLGSGAWGFNPYIVYSYLAPVSPHLKIGYQWNTASELDNPTNVRGNNQKLPGGLQYDLGADWAANRRFTVAAALLGNQYLNAPKLLTANTAIKGVPGGFLPTSTTQNSSYSINNVSTGFKWNPAGGLVLSANVLFQINNVGLRARPTPLVGISYKFK